MRKTKIVCTLGPACEDEETLRGMCLAGMNVARLNMSHGTYEEHARRIAVLKKVRQELNLPIALMLDTKGPEYRIKTLKNDKVCLREGAPFIFTTRDVEGDETIVSVNYSHLTEELSVGDTVLLNNGLLAFAVEKIEGTEIYCRVTDGGELSSRKSMSFPGKVLKQEYFSEQDKKDVLFGLSQGIDFIACSFVSCKEDLQSVRRFLTENGGEDIDLIAKIENQSGVDHIEEICEEAGGIMVARGDMGVEIPYENLPAIQKNLITKCRMLGKRVITATEMLESMIHQTRPTRAEISDVANAVYDGTSAIMLSGETAAGKYPVQAVRVMAKIAETAEGNIDYNKRFYASEFRIKNTVDAISHATCGMAIDIGAKVIVACSLSGMTARMVSRFRSNVDIIGLTTDERTWRKLALSWAVTPAVCERFTSTEVLFYSAKKIAKEICRLGAGDKIVITGGDVAGTSGNTNLIKVERI